MGLMRQQETGGSFPEFSYTQECVDVLKQGVAIEMFIHVKGTQTQREGLLICRSIKATIIPIVNS